MKVQVKTENGGPLNMRTSPNKSASVFKQIPNGVSLEAPDGIGEEWTKIIYKETPGYVMTKFLSNSQKIFTKDDLQKIYNNLKQTLQTIENILK